MIFCRHGTHLPGGEGLDHAGGGGHAPDPRVAWMLMNAQLSSTIDFWNWPRRSAHPRQRAAGMARHLDNSRGARRVWRAHHRGRTAVRLFTHGCPGAVREQLHAVLGGHAPPASGPKNVFLVAAFRAHIRLMFSTIRATGNGDFF